MQLSDDFRAVLAEIHRQLVFLPGIEDPRQSLKRYFPALTEPQYTNLCDTLLEAVSYIPEDRRSGRLKLSLKPLDEETDRLAHRSRKPEDSLYAPTHRCRRRSGAGR